MTLKTDWATGDVVDATYLNQLDTAVNTVPSDTAAAITAAQLIGTNTQTANYTLVIGDANKAIEMNKATAVTVTVPPNSPVAFPIGTVVEIVQIGAGQVTVVAGSGVTINTPTTLNTRVQWSTVALRKRGTDTWLLTGDAA